MVCDLIEPILNSTDGEDNEGGRRLLASGGSFVSCKFPTGSYAKCLHKDNKQYLVKVEDHKMEAREGMQVPLYFVHYNGWRRTHDEWVEEDKLEAAPAEMVPAHARRFLLPTERSSTPQLLERRSKKLSSGGLSPKKISGPGSPPSPLPTVSPGGTLSTLDKAAVTQSLPSTDNSCSPRKRKRSNQPLPVPAERCEQGDKALALAMAHGLRRETRRSWQASLAVAQRQSEEDWRDVLGDEPALVGSQDDNDALLRAATVDSDKQNLAAKAGLLSTAVVASAGQGPEELEEPAPRLRQKPASKRSRSKKGEAVATEDRPLPSAAFENSETAQASYAESTDCGMVLEQVSNEVVGGNGGGVLMDVDDAEEEEEEEEGLHQGPGLTKRRRGVPGRPCKKRGKHTLSSAEMQEQEAPMVSSDQLLQPASSTLAPKFGCYTPACGPHRGCYAPTCQFLHRKRPILNNLSSKKQRSPYYIEEYVCWRTFPTFCCPRRS